jgi:beta-1,4-mannooligosaccharide/beta-1,4-mannosyl-N-acetylglucosamine phosphorylase
MKSAVDILKRAPENPIMSIRNYPEIAQLFNPAVVKHDGEFIMLVSVVLHASHGGEGHTRIARSHDGINFTLSEDIFIKVPDLFPYNEMCHFIDNRITQLGDTYYIVTPVCMKNSLSPVGLLGKTKDFSDYEVVDVITAPRNRGASLFPDMINGKYYKLDRPYDLSTSGGGIWISSSPDLVHWGCFRPLLEPGYAFWNGVKIGPTPPIKTQDGYLVITHGVSQPAGGTYYYIGAIMLDLNEPWRIRGKTQSYLLAPEMEYERHGACDNTVFPCTPYADMGNDRLYLYYGACDQAIALATGRVSEIVEACLG